MEYNFRDIEKKWQQHWRATGVYKVANESGKPKCYVLDMFPYPSGSGLHVGHPLGYIASDIYSRYKRLKGYNVLHPMGFDSFGLPAEQYALDTGQHPAETTKKNIATFKSQLDNIGFCYDWSREVQTSDPTYYKWTQWIFLRLFKSFYNRVTGKAEPIDNLVAAFEKEGNGSHSCPGDPSLEFSAQDWKSYDDKKKMEVLMEYRLSFCGNGEVNWCEALGTVLANDEVVNGVSERGGYPVVKKKLRQWYLRITEYADRLLEGLETVDFSDAMKEMQTNWIGKSEGAEVQFEVRGSESGEKTEELSKLSTVSNSSGSAQVSPFGGDLEGATLRVYTTRPDTIFGVDFMVIAPEHEMVEQISSADQKLAVDEYIAYVKSRSERERMAEKKISGVFTGAYALNPFDGREIPVWISEYVLAGYGTGAIMGVPCGDERDHKFARHFNIPITNIIGSHYNGEEANPTKEAVLENSGFLNGIVMKGAIDIVIKAVEERGIGTRKVNYKMRDAAFSRQRYWGEPFPIKWINGIAYPMDESELPLVLPEVEKYGPGPDGEGPLANLPAWVQQKVKIEKPFGSSEVPSFGGDLGEAGALETNTMPGYAGSSWYFLRYMDPHNDQAFCDRKVSDYWNQVDIYIGGTEHAVGHLLYSRMWTKFLYDLNLIGFDEPFKKLVNQGMIQGSSRFVYRINTAGIEGMLRDFLSSNFKEYNFVTGDFDEPPLFDFRGNLNGVEFLVEISNFENLKAKAKKYSSIISGKENVVTILISNNEFLSQKFNGTARSWFEGILKNQKEYQTQNKDKSIFFISKSKAGEWNEWEYDAIHVDVNIVDGLELDIQAFRNWREEYSNAYFILEDGSVNAPLSSGEGLGVRSEDAKYICGSEVEKMSKSKFNTVNPDDLVAKYGADTFRMYEMFLGPVEMSKPWDTKGIEGVHRFLKKFWRLFIDEIKGSIITGDQPIAAELKVLHNAIKKIESDTERFSFNTAVSAFMIATNDLTDLKCHKRSILEPLLVLLTPYAPHIAEELYRLLEKTSSPGREGDSSVLNAPWPVFEEKYVKKSTKSYPVAINGKTRHEITLPLDISQQQVEETVLKDEVVQKWLEGKQPKKIIYVKNKMINVVV